MSIPAETIRELVAANADHDCESPGCVRIVAVADLPTRFGDFQVVAFHSPTDQKEHAALVRGNPLGQEGVPVRLHSECLTGDTFGSYRCDCRDQLELSLRAIGQMERGVVIYLRQEGRGIGFANKIRAYQLQELGYDTIQANEILGFRADERDYAVAAHILQSLDVRSIQLMSNNPHKVADLQFHGVKILGRVALEVPANPYNRRYLETKRIKAGHLLESPGAESLSEQVDSAANGVTEPHSS